MRSSAIDTLAQDYIKAGPGQGPAGAAGPVAAPGPQRLPADDHPDRPVDPGILLAGNLIVEAVFNYHGLGLLFYDALGTADYPILLAYTLVGAVLVVVGKLRRRHRPDRRRPADPARLTGPGDL